jgi:hypothetical protein
LVAQNVSAGFQGVNLRDANRSFGPENGALLPRPISRLFTSPGVKQGLDILKHDALENRQQARYGDTSPG